MAATFVRTHTRVTSLASASTVTLTTSAAIPPGNMLAIGVIAQDSSSGSAGFISASKPASEPNSWGILNQYTSPNIVSGLTNSLAIAMIQTSTTWSTGQTVTVTLSNPTNNKVVVYALEFTGFPVDPASNNYAWNDSGGQVTSGHNIPVSTTAQAAGIGAAYALNIAQPGDLVLSLVSTSRAGTSNTYTLNSGWTQGDQSVTGASNQISGVFAYSTGTGAIATFNPTQTLALTSGTVEGNGIIGVLRAMPNLPDLRKQTRAAVTRASVM